MNAATNKWGNRNGQAWLHESALSSQQFEKYYGQCGVFEVEF